MSATNHVIKVTDRKISVEGSHVVANGIGSDTITLELDAQWDDLTAVVYVGDPCTALRVQWDGDPIAIPAQKMDHPGWLPVSVVGYDSTGAAREATEAARTPNPGLVAVAKLAIRSVDFTSISSTDVVAAVDYVPNWSDVAHFKQNDPCVYMGVVYRASKDHDRQDVYPPDVAGESMYYPITVAPDGIIVYRTCHGDYDMVHKGERRHYPDAEGPVYEALEDTAYSPDTYPDHWKLTTDAE